MNSRGELRHRMWADVDSQTLSGFVFHPSFSWSSSPRSSYSLQSTSYAVYAVQKLFF